MDREAISALLPEQLHSQWYLSYQGYQSVCDDLILNGIAKSEAWEVAANQFHKSCKAQIASWQDNGTIDYMAQHIANYGGQFLLVAGPRRDLTYNQLLQLVCVFNQHALASGAEIAQQLYIEPLKKVTYRPPVQENLVQLTLLPLRGIPVAANVDESDHLSYVERMRLQRSGANLRVPSLSEAIYYWHSLAAHNLINEKTQDEIEALSFIWHFDLAPKQAKDYYSVQSLLGNERNARLQYQGMPEQDFIRLAVG